MPERVPWRKLDDGVELAVRLTPRSGGARIEGVVEHGGQCWLKLRVAAPPVEGAANAELIGFLARTLRLPRSDIALIAGERGREKRLRLKGEGIGERLGVLIGTGTGGPEHAA